MSSIQQLNAGETHGQTQARAEDSLQATKDSAQAAKDNAVTAAHSAQDGSQEGTDQAAGFLQQTGEQVKHMAQGAVDTVKNTLGMGDQSK